MKKPTLKLPEKLQPFKSVILFAVILMLSNVIWKYNIKGDEASQFDSVVSLWGMNISAPFVWMAHQVSHTSLWLLRFFGFNVSLQPGNIIAHANGNSVQIIWACTGLKQAYIFFCIIAFYRGPWMKKLWFVPLGLLVVYFFNIFRITFIIAVVEKHPEWFHFLHLYAFKYAFYLIIFLMWVLWEEKFAVKNHSDAVNHSEQVSSLR